MSVRTHPRLREVAMEEANQTKHDARPLFRRPGNHMLPRFAQESLRRSGPTSSSPGKDTVHRLSCIAPSVAASPDFRRKLANAREGGFRFLAEKPLDHDRLVGWSAISAAAQARGIGFHRLVHPERLEQRLRLRDQKLRASAKPRRWPAGAPDAQPKSRRRLCDRVLLRQRFWRAAQLRAFCFWATAMAARKAASAGAGSDGFGFLRGFRRASGSAFGVKTTRFAPPRVKVYCLIQKSLGRHHIARSPLQRPPTLSPKELSNIATPRLRCSLYPDAFAKRWFIAPIFH